MRSRKQKISKKVFKKLAARNVKKSAKDYFIYFLTLTFAVCLFYTFNSIKAQFSVLGIPDTLNYLAASQGAIVAVSIVSCIIIGFLVAYANGFLMKRRKKEFGVYFVLGMERKDVGHILMKETVKIGFASLVSGLVLGVFASQGLSMITARLAGIGLSGYRFVFSPESVAAAIVFFAITFACVHIFNVRQVKKMKLIDLLYAERKNEEMPKPGKRDGMVTLLSVLLMAAGYFVIFKWIDRFFMASVMGGGGLVAVGTILFFLSAGSAVMHFLKQKKGFYYKGLHIFDVNQLGSRIKTTGTSIAVVCILMYLAVSTMGISMGMGQSEIMGKKKLVPYDVTIEYYFGDDRDEEFKTNSIISELKNHNAAVTEYIEPKAEFTIYKSGDLKDNQLFGDFTRNKKEEKMFGNYPVSIIGLEDYNKVLESQGKKPVTLEGNQYALVYNNPDARRVLERYAKAQNKPMQVGNASLNLKEGAIFETTLNNQNVFVDTGILLVPQQTAESTEPYIKVSNSMYKGNADEAYAALEKDMLDITFVNFKCRTDLMVELMSRQLTVTYVGNYLGITFLVTAGAVLALQQLTQSSENEKRYKLLSRLGVGERGMKKSLLTQMKVYFGLPFAVAAVHSAFITTGAYQSVPYLTTGAIVQNILFGAGLAAVIYMVYFMTTYAGCKQILKL